MAKVSPSTLQMQLARDQVFLNRVQYLMLKHARTVKAEATTVPYHTQRTQYAAQVLSNPSMVAASAAALLVGGSLLAGTADMDDAGIISTADDTLILNQIIADWNVLSGVDSSTLPSQPAATFGMPGMMPPGPMPMPGMQPPPMMPPPPAAPEPKRG